MKQKQRWVMAGGECWHYERSCAEHNLRADQPFEAYLLEDSAVPSFYRPCKRCVPIIPPPDKPNSDQSSGSGEGPQ